MFFCVSTSLVQALGGFLAIHQAREATEATPLSRRHARNISVADDADVIHVVIHSRLDHNCQHSRISTNFVTKDDQRIPPDFARN